MPFNCLTLAVYGLLKGERVLTVSATRVTLSYFTVIIAFFEIGEGQIRKDILTY